MCHALIIEDEPLIAFHIGDVVEAAGARSIAYAQTELEAISAAMERKPDIIVSDVKLATGTGPDAVTSIRAQVGRVPAIFITGNPEALDAYDHDGVMQKPFQADRLKQQVARFAADC
jgi:CheY-like chemotaxis protein